MSNWLTLVSLLIQLVLQIVRYLEGRQKLQQDAAVNLKNALETANEIVRNANGARDAVTDSPDDIMRDPRNDGGTNPSSGTGNSEGGSV